MTVIHIPVLDLQNPTKSENYVDRLSAKGTPLYWRDDMSGQLKTAIWAFLNHTPSPDQLQTVIAYIQYHIHAPCWLETCPWDVDEETAENVRTLRRLSLDLKTEREVQIYIASAMNMALDPL